MKYIKDININMVFLALIITRVLIFGASIGDSIALVGLAALFGFSTYLNRKDDNWRDAVNKELTTLRNEMQSMRLNNTIIRKSHDAKKAEDGKRWF